MLSTGTHRRNPARWGGGGALPDLEPVDGLSVDISHEVRSSRLRFGGGPVGAAGAGALAGGAAGPHAKLPNPSAKFPSAIGSERLEERCERLDEPCGAL